jgi:hypothetical protein
MKRSDSASRADIDAARTLRKDLCQGKNVFTMRVPVDHRNDSDMILSHVIKAAAMFVAVEDLIDQGTHQFKFCDAEPFTKNYTTMLIAAQLQRMKVSEFYVRTVEAHEKTIRDLRVLNADPSSSYPKPPSPRPTRRLHMPEGFLTGRHKEICYDRQKPWLTHAAIAKLRAYNEGCMPLVHLKWIGPGDLHA